MTNFKSSKLKEFADDNFEFDDNGRKFSKRVENTNKPLILLVCCTSLLKTLWEKKKLLITSKFSFFPQCFLPLLENFQPFSSNLKLSANSFSLEESKICCFGKG